MSWLEKISVNTHYTRSTHLERDASSVDVIASYIPTTRALRVIKSIGDTLNAESLPRAWALTGPYGSGKSSFAVFLSHLLGGNPHTAQIAQNVLEESDARLAQRFKANVSAKGHCKILLTGSPEPLGLRLLQAIRKGAFEYWERGRGRRPTIIAMIEQAISSEDVSTSQIVELLNSLQRAVANSGGSGLLIVIDELGKFLEYEARHYGANDIYLLQAIAELACSEGAVPLQCVVLMHQSFEQYARGLGESSKAEWQKVQGRFESVPFLESTEQTLRIIRATLSRRLDKNTENRISKLTATIAETLAKAKALPGSMEKDAAAELFAGCYPLHPITLLLLPVLCQRVAQSERTLFSYLGSQEVHGFRDSLSNLEANNSLPWVMPWEIYEYFIQNQPIAVADHFTHRKWAEVVTAVERLDDAAGHEENLLKTIGLLNIIGAQGGFKASIDILDTCYLEQQEKIAHQSTSKALKQLQEMSLVTFRKFNGEYRVWQGSDFDIEAELQRELHQLAYLELADVLNERKVLPPVVARRHTISTGTLRYFTPMFVDKKVLKKLDHCSDVSRILIFLAETKEDEKQYLSEAKLHSGGLALSMIYPNGAEVRLTVTEVIALERIQRNSSELSHDPVGQRELKDRLHAARFMEGELLKAILDGLGGSRWFYGQQELNICNKRALQVELSKVSGDIYCQAPLIRNEMINRDKLSSSAAAGRNRLFEAMLEHEIDPDLEIEKYPAEKAIYKSALQASGLHVFQNNKWQFSVPPNDDPCRVKPAWDAMDIFFNRSELHALPVLELFEELKRPPYGLKDGLVPVLFIAAYLVNQHELALYEEGSFVPALNPENLARLLKNPDTFSIQCFRLSGMRVSVYEKYIEIITGEKKQKKNLLAVARPLAKFLGGLPEYTKRTKTLSPKAIAVREAYFKSKSPADLLFSDLPVACGCPAFKSDKGSQGLAEKFSKAFVKVLRELKNAYPTLLRNIQDKLTLAFPDCEASDLGQLRQNIRGRCLGLDKFTIDAEGLKAFILRLCDVHGDDQQWLEGLGTFLGRKPPTKWRDEDVQFVDFRLAELSQRLLDLEGLRFVYAKNKDLADPTFEAILLRIVRQNVHELSYVVPITETEKELGRRVMPSILEELEKLPSEHQQLALLTELVDGVLEQLHGKSSSSASASKKRREVNE